MCNGLGKNALKFSLKLIVSWLTNAIPDVLSPSEMSLIFETEPLAKFLHCGCKYSVSWFWEFLPKQFPDYWFVRPTEGFEYTGCSLHIICIAAVLSCILGTTLFAVSRSRPCWFCPRLPFMHLVPHQLRMFLSCFWCPSWHIQYLRFVLVRLSILPHKWNAETR